MQISDILAANRIKCAVPCSSKKKIFETISQLAEDVNNDILQADVLESLVVREKMGSTGIGNGIAIPHGRIAGLDNVVAILVTSAEKIEFEAIDRQPVDVFFALLVPESQIDGHLHTLASVAAKLTDTAVVAQLRKATAAEHVLDALV